MPPPPLSHPQRTNLLGGKVDQRRLGPLLLPLRLLALGAGRRADAAASAAAGRGKLAVELLLALAEEDLLNLKFRV